MVVCHTVAPDPAQQYEAEAHATTLNVALATVELAHVTPFEVVITSAEEPSPTLPTAMHESGATQLISVMFGDIRWTAHVSELVRTACPRASGCPGVLLGGADGTPSPTNSANASGCAIL